MSAIVVLKFPSGRIQPRRVGSTVGSGAVIPMARENVKRKPATKPSPRKRIRYIPDWQPLSRKWAELEGPKHLSQKQLAGLANSTEGMISQLLKGKTKLTIEWALQFVMYMDIPVTEIWPDFPFAKLVPGH